jgi:hypothetical protein
MDELAKKFDSFESLMSQALDKLTGLEAWKTTAEDATDKLLTQSERFASRLLRLESVPPPPPPLPSSTRPLMAPL